MSDKTSDQPVCGMCGESPAQMCLFDVVVDPWICGPCRAVATDTVILCLPESAPEEFELEGELRARPHANPIHVVLDLWEHIYDEAPSGAHEMREIVERYGSEEEQMASELMGEGRLRWEHRDQGGLLIHGLLPATARRLVAETDVVCAPEISEEETARLAGGQGEPA